MNSLPPSVRRAAVALVAAAAFGLSGPVVASAQTPSTPVPSQGVGDVPSVAVVPADAKPDDPNGGQWFAITLKPGELGTLRAKVGNPANVAQRITFTIQDLVFADDGTPSVNDGKQEDVGAWGVLTTKTLDMQPQQIFTVPFQIKVPAGADPGDHVGVLVATTTNLQGQFKVNRRIATRLYVTVPGDATKDYEITSVDPKRDSAFFPGSITTKVRLRNTGRIRLTPTVTVRGKKATGPEVLLSRSNEEYVSEVKVPWYGGIVKLPVRVETKDGLTRTADKTVIVIPYGLIIGLVLAAVALWLLVRWWRRRSSKVAGLRADIERLERMVTKPEAAAVAVPVATEAELAHDEQDEEVHALLAALKRAQRTGSAPSVARLALSLHDLGGEATSWLVAALRMGDTTYRGEIVSTLAGMEPAAISAALGRSAADKALLAEVAEARAAVEAERAPARKAPVKRAAKPAKAVKSGDSALPSPRAPRKSESAPPPRRKPSS
jgi:dihydroorotate dehydrogenase (fumarate)